MSVSCDLYVCGQVETSASVLSLVQRIPTECGVSECDREAPQGEAMIRNRVEALQEKILIKFNFYMSYLFGLLTNFYTFSLASRVKKFVFSSSSHFPYHANVLSVLIFGF